MSESLDAKYFQRIYEEADDPWNFATSSYEQLKYSDTLGSLQRARYQNALEIGCSIGVLTERLAQRCERLLAIDVSEKALAAARTRSAHLRNVTFQKVSVPAEYPNGAFDLTILSEIGYYFSLPDLGRLAEEMISHLTAEGHLMLVHWTPIVADYPLTGDKVHDYILRLRGLRHIHGHRRDKYRLDIFQRE